MVFFVQFCCDLEFIEFSGFHGSAAQFDTHCSMVQCTALQYGALHCNVLQHIAVNCIALQYSAVLCIALLYGGVQCIAFQNSAMQYCTVQFPLQTRATS